MIKSKDLFGVFPPVPTPFNESGEVALDKLASNLEKLAVTALTGFVILGSNGEYVYLDDAEKFAMFETARKAIPADRLRYCTSILPLPPGKPSRSSAPTAPARARSPIC